MLIWDKGWGRALVCGVIIAAGLTISLCGIASAHGRHLSLKERRLLGWHFVHIHIVRGHMLHRRGDLHGGGSDLARVAIVGGSHASVEQGPWQVALIGEIPIVYEGKEGVLHEVCGGVILDETRVVTAAHCMFDPLTGGRVPMEDFVVVAGSSDLADEEATEQDVGVAGARVHPYYSYNPEAARSLPDDVAVLQLDKPLVFNLAVNAISLASGGSLAQEGAAVSLAGFGEQSVAPEELNGGLYSIGMTLAFGADCGGEDDALFLCASTPAGSLCFGDSGSGLIIPGSPATLIGIADTVEVISNEPCRDGSLGGFANVTAPEIQDFIADSATPPMAPRGGTGMTLTSKFNIPNTGESLTCSPGNWSGEPTFTYSFIDSPEGHILQTGASSVYPLTQDDVGLAIFCQVEATNTGGTGVQRTNALQPVSGASQSSIEADNRTGEEDAKAYAAMRAREQQLVVEEEQAKLRAQDETFAREEREFIEREQALAKTQKPTAPRCVVPSLKRDSLKKARRALVNANCRLVS